ncbi:hypothetical protein L218DRAFT_946789 [Marasmius fiardii PR-910]|nr:hypothetical protein L218DRAFT_946789 [Marasmius fiardii PR-910]
MLIQRLTDSGDGVQKNSTFSLRILLFFLLVLSCSGFKITIPSPIGAGSTNTFHLMLVSPLNSPEDFNCQSLGVRGETVSGVVESFDLAKVPFNTNGSLGNVVLTANKQGTFNVSPHVSPNATEATSTVTATTLTPISATPMTPGSATTMTPSSETTSVVTATTLTPSSETPKNGGSHKAQISQIIGGVIGGIALAALILAIIIYQRISYRRKLVRLSDQQQLSPTPFLWIIASTIIPRSAKKSRLSVNGQPGSMVGNTEIINTELSPPTYARSNPPSYSDVVPPIEPCLPEHLGNVEKQLVRADCNLAVIGNL